MISNQLTTKDKTSIISGYVMTAFTVILLIVFYVILSKNNNKTDLKFYRFAVIFGYILCLTWESMIANNIGWKIEFTNKAARKLMPKWAQILTQPIYDLLIVIFVWVFLGKTIFKNKESLVDAFATFSPSLLVWFFVIGVSQEFIYDGFMMKFARYPPHKGWNGPEIYNGTAMPFTWVLMPFIYYFGLYMYARKLRNG